MHFFVLNPLVHVSPSNSTICVRKSPNTVGLCLANHTIFMHTPYVCNCKCIHGKSQPNLKHSGLGEVDIVGSRDFLDDLSDGELADGEHTFKEALGLFGLFVGLLRKTPANREMPKSAASVLKNVVTWPPMTLPFQNGHFLEILERHNITPSLQDHFFRQILEKLKKLSIVR